METFSSWILCAVFFWWIRDRVTKVEARLDKLEAKTSGSAESRPGVW